jgi:hypothetical protein
MTCRQAEVLTKFGFEPLYFAALTKPAGAEHVSGGCLFLDA